MNWPTCQSVLVAAAVMLTGCASNPTVKVHNGGQLKADQVALITSTRASLMGGGRQDAFILKVDGIALKKSEVDSHASIEVLPGMHRLTVAAMITRDGRRFPFEDPQPMIAQLAAGERYSVMCSLAAGPTGNQAIVRFWMEDSSGNVVAGTR